MSTRLLGTEFNTSVPNPESPDWVPYKSSYISEAEAGIHEAFENAKIKEANRELMLIARENYNE